MQELIDECRNERVIFHTRYWSDVSDDAKDFIKSLLKADPKQRPTSEEALKHRWLTGKTASDYNLLPEIRAYVAKARLKRGIELVRLANRIENLKMQEDEQEDAPGMGDMPAGANEAAGSALAKGMFGQRGLTTSEAPVDTTRAKKKLSDLAKGAIFREIVLAKVREVKEAEARKKFEEEVLKGGEKK